MQICESLGRQRPWRRWLSAIGPIFRKRHRPLGTLADVEPLATSAAFEQNSQP
jgi:hypothetical protein